MNCPGLQKATMRKENLLYEMNCPGLQAGDEFDNIRYPGFSPCYNGTKVRKVFFKNPRPSGWGLTEYN
jgi:hypothetical protein